MDKRLIQEVKKKRPNLLRLLMRAESTSLYDKEADVLYISYAKQTTADDTLIFNDFFVRVKKDKAIGVTIVNVADKLL